MERRQLMRRIAVAGGVGLTGVVAYDQATDGTGGSNPAVTTTTGGTTTDRRGPPYGTQPSESSTARPTTTTDHPTTEGPPPRHESEFGTVVDAVRAGADPEGEEPIGDVLRDNAADDTLIAFPAGTYRFPQVELSGYDHLGITAAHDERPTFVAPAHSCTSTDPHIQFTEITDFLLEGIDFDFRNPGAGGAINVIATGDATVRNLGVRGSCQSQVAMFRIDIRDPGGTGVVENVRLEHVQDTGWLTGAYVGQRHSGTVTFRDCDVREFTDNGLYGSAPGVSDGGGGGVVHTEGGHFENNNVSNIRLGTAGSTATGDTIVVESAPDAETLNLRGIRFRRGGDQTVEDCEIRYGPDATDSFGAVVFHADSGGARLADSQLTMDADAVPAIRAFYHSGGGEGPPTIENVTVDGEASRGYAMQINGRDGTVIEDCTIEQPGDRRDGIRIAYSKNCEIVDSRVEVTGFPLILRDSTVTVRNTTFVTPDGERHVDRMEAGPGDFRPGEWTG